MNHVFTIATDTTAGVPVWLQIQSGVTRSSTGGIVSVAAVWRRVELGREQRAKSGDRWRDWRTRSAAASEAAKREQLVLERRYAKAILRMEGVIQSGLRMGGSAGHVSAARDLMGAYLDEAGRAPLLSREDEIAIAKRIKAGGHDGQVARGEMARANLLLVVKIAMKYTKRLTPRSKYDLEFLDLIQQGNIGMMAAIDKFDYQRGNRFSTYATWKIMDAITKPLKKPELNLSFHKNIDELAAAPASGWPGVPAKKKSVPKSSDDPNDRDYNSASYSRPHGAVIEARKRTKAMSESVFSRSGFGYGLSQEEDYTGVADLTGSEESEQVRQEKADGTYEDPLTGREEL